MEYQVNKRKKKTGGQEISIIIAIVGLSVVLVGGFYLRNTPGPPPFVTATTGTLCCDTGNGVDCHPQTNLPEITYNGQQYALLKSNITNSLCGRHHKDTGTKVTINGQSYPLVIDTSNELTGECGNNNQDQLVCRDAQGNKTCIPIPNDELIYVCKANCTTPPLSSCCDAAPDHYGNPTTILDVYYRVADQNNIPPVIKDCQNCTQEDSDYHSGPNCPLKPGGSSASGSANPQILLTPLPYPTHHTEQLHTFTFGQSTANPNEWMRSFCKPAIYLYPQTTEEVKVRIAPKGKLMETIPSYPSAGWDVIAHPDGTIETNNTTYSYLYYEAGIADSLLPDTKKGYVESDDKLGSLFSSLLPKLGLNENEMKQFSEYWIKALPKSPYYFISIVPQTTLNQISPLTISPTPDSLIRVTLDFEPLDKKIDVVPPTLTSVERKGFTVVEWGGLFKKDKNHPFHCLQ